MRLTKLLISQKAIFNFVKMRSALFCDLPNKHNNHTSSLKQDNSEKKDNLRIKENKDTLVDSQGHHIKSDGEYDMRYKENNPDAGNPGQTGDNRGQFSGNFDTSHHHLKTDGTHDMRFKENKDSGIESPEDEKPWSKK
jgi:hypothetical protein